MLVRTGIHAAAERPWDEIPAVAVFGVVVGVALLVAAIRGMFGGKDK